MSCKKKFVQSSKTMPRPFEEKILQFNHGQKNPDRKNIDHRTPPQKSNGPSLTS